ncbi:MAG: 3-oxoacyl-(acyl-carrier-protein) reductase [Verrucomicrobiaceae bacterium]|nr:3-oxoacyl-(acyl-carrier-protein) reductase [Verrucomicrobiaceae bacterium]
MAARVALITGGEGDLAQAVRIRLEADGWQVHAPGKAVLDVTSTASTTAYFGDLHRIDLLINNAGLVNDALVASMTSTQWESVLAVNLDGAFRCCRDALKLMVKQRAGHIINIGSFSALSGPIGQANYAAAKAGLVGLTRSLAREYGPRNVRCNCVLPGFLETKMTRTLLEKRRTEVLATHALGSLNTTEEAARFIAHLDSFAHISGQVFQLDSRVHG